MVKPPLMTPTRSLCHLAWSVCLLVLFVLATARAEASDDLKLWFEQPAKEWSEALPIGNGRLGAMVYGGIDLERLQLNEDTLWSGGPHSYDNPDAFKHLAKVRDLLQRGEYAEAEATAQEMLGQPKYQAAYQPLGDLTLKFPQGEKSTDYHRELDLQAGVASVAYSIGNARYTRRVFASHPDQAIVIRLECDKPGRLSFDLALSSPHPSQSRAAGAGTLTMSGQVAPRTENKQTGSRGLISLWDGEGMKFAAQVNVSADGGSVIAQGDKVSVRHANAVTLCYSAATSYVNHQDIGGDPIERIQGDLAAVEGKTFDQLLQRHRADYSALFGRVRLDLGGGKMDSLPTDELLQTNAEGQADPRLAELVFQYGRYLMIAGSRPGTQPLNLQGIWSNDLDPPWGSKYTININIQMNYWVAEVCDLSECHEPLLRMVGELQEPGRKTAREHYKASGWMAHHNTDLWRGTAPVDGAQWGMWPMGGAWLCQHLWEHYLYTGDTEHLERSYPILKGAVAFFLDALVETGDGHLITSPSLSPEHSHGGG
ncbi:MAG: glycoside hydrolase family 95 protein, partial [Verrucomicrobiales bacterium]